LRAIADVILEIDASLASLNVRHAFGGALALAYYAEPRGTVDVDINVGIAYESRSTLLAHLDQTGWHVGGETDQTLPAAGTRLHQTGETVVVDLFFAFASLHDDALDRAVAKPFFHEATQYELRFLSAEDLTVFKISFGRTKDWVDIEAMIAAGTPIDANYVEHQLVQFKGPTVYPATARLRAMLRGHPQ
jgi:hypothetical protein